MRADTRCPRRGSRLLILICSIYFVLTARPAALSASDYISQNKANVAREKVIVDTDIGMDIDDAFAVALALRSPELNLVGFSTASGDTVARAKILDRLLAESGLEKIPVSAGIPTTSSDQYMPTGMIGLQRRYGENTRYAKASHSRSVDFILEQIQQFPDRKS